MTFITNCWCVDLLISIVCGIVIFYIYVIRDQTYWEKRGVKSAPKPNFFGHFTDCIFLKKDLRTVLTDIYSHGEGEKFIGFYVFNKPFLLLRDPEAIKYVLVKNFKNFTNRCISPHEKDKIGNFSIFAIKNPGWQVLRQSVSPIFSTSKFRSMNNSVAEVCRDLDTYLQSKIDDEWKIIEIKEVCEKFTTDIIGHTMFGLKFESLTNENAEFRKEGMKHFQTTYKQYMNLLALFFMPFLIRLLKLKFFDSHIPHFFSRVIPKIMAERIATGVQKNDLVDALVKLKETHQDKGDIYHKYFQDEGLVGTSIVFFLGGFEPSASVLYFTLYELAKQTEIQDRLRREILTALEKTNGEITHDLMSNMPYLEMVFSESARKYPLLHFIDRVPEEDFTFPDTDVTIEKGTPIIISLSSVHLDPNNFPDPERFDPERFSNENKNDVTSFTYIPFGEGPRNCVGMRLGIMQVKAGLIKILSKYEVAPCKETPIPLVFDKCTIFTKSLYNMKLQIRRIKTKNES